MEKMSSPYLVDKHCSENKCIHKLECLTNRNDSHSGRKYNCLKGSIWYIIENKPQNREFLEFLKKGG